MAILKLSSGSLCSVDDDLHELLSQYRWHENKDGYVWTRIDDRTVYMHRFIMNCPKGLTVDHEDGDTLNNMRYNLRIATYGQNNCNRTKKGIRFIKKVGKFRVEFTFKGKSYFFGEYYTEDMAKFVYNKNVEILHGEFARLLKLETPIPVIEENERIAEIEHFKAMKKKSKHRYLSQQPDGKWIVQKWDSNVKSVKKYGSFDTEELAYQCAVANNLYK